jgi:hypothetical protein
MLGATVRTGFPVLRAASLAGAFRTLDCHVEELFCTCAGEFGRGLFNPGAAGVMALPLVVLAGAAEGLLAGAGALEADGRSLREPMMTTEEAREFSFRTIGAVVGVVGAGVAATGDAGAVGAITVDAGVWRPFRVPAFRGLSACTSGVGGCAPVVGATAEPVVGAAMRTFCPLPGNPKRGV